MKAAVHAIERRAVRLREEIVAWREVSAGEPRMAKKAVLWTIWCIPTTAPKTLKTLRSKQFSLWDSLVHDYGKGIL
jgi:hypothetical protein